MPPVQRSQAAWKQVAVDLSGDLRGAAELGVRSMAQVAEATGLSVATIDDCMGRPEATDPGNARTYLCRPRYRVGSVPYWAPDQLDDAVRVRHYAPPEGEPVPVNVPAGRRNQAAWERAAEDLSSDLGPVPGLDLYGMLRVADATGLTQTTINDAMYRPVATAPTNPRTYLCRPRYRVGSTPYWTGDQVAAAQRTAAGRGAKVGAGPELPMVDPDADVVGVRDIAHAVGRHEQTVRKWTAGSYTTAHIETADDDSTAEPFPSPVGRRAQPAGRRAGNPETVYDRAEIHRWLYAELGITCGELSTPEAAAAVHYAVLRAAAKASAAKRVAADVESAAVAR